jgi:lysophospholipase L1-like esterase
MLIFTPTTATDTFEVVAYVSNDETYQLTIDGAAPAGGPASFTTTASSGFVRKIVTAASAGTRRLGVAGTTQRGALRSVTAYAGGVPALDMIVHAALGVRASEQAATGNGWSNREALIFDAPDLTIVMLGLNDMAGGVGASSYAGALSAIVTAARLSGDVLLVFPPSASGNYNRDVAAFRDAAAGVARDAGVAFLSLYDHFGPFDAAMAARMADGEVHPNAQFAADIAAVIHRALRLMAPGL